MVLFGGWRRRRAMPRKIVFDSDVEEESPIMIGDAKPIPTASPVALPLASSVVGLVTSGVLCEINRSPEILPCSDPTSVPKRIASPKLFGEEDEENSVPNRAACGAAKIFHSFVSGDASVDFSALAAMPLTKKSQKKPSKARKSRRTRVSRRTVASSEQSPSPPSKSVDRVVKMISDAKEYQFNTTIEKRSQPNDRKGKAAVDSSPPSSDSCGNQSFDKGAGTIIGCNDGVIGPIPNQLSITSTPFAGQSINRRPLLPKDELASVSPVEFNIDGNTEPDIIPTSVVIHSSVPPPPMVLNDRPGFRQADDSLSKAHMSSPLVSYPRGENQIVTRLRRLTLLLSSANQQHAVAAPPLLGENTTVQRLSPIVTDENDISEPAKCLFGTINNRRRRPRNYRLTESQCFEPDEIASYAANCRMPEVINEEEEEGKEEDLEAEFERDAPELNSFSTSKVSNGLENQEDVESSESRSDDDRGTNALGDGGEDRDEYRSDPPDSSSLFTPQSLHHSSVYTIAKRSNDDSLSDHSLTESKSESQVVEVLRHSDHSRELDNLAYIQQELASMSIHPQNERIEASIVTEIDDDEMANTKLSHRVNYSRLSVDSCNTNSPFYLRGRELCEKTPLNDLLWVCGQEDVLDWFVAFPDKLCEYYSRMINSASKIGEGVYGEVFRTVNSVGDSVALKVIPVEGAQLVNGAQQKTLAEILPEVLIAKQLSELKHSDPLNSTPNFVNVISVKLIQGEYPEQLLCCWDDYNEERCSENDRPGPDLFDCHQLFLVFEFGDGGCNLENAKLKEGDDALSIYRQVVLTLAVAEKAMEFEHRDLHIGNILVKSTSELSVGYVIDGRRISVPSNGWHVYIIDFTLSRLKKGGCTLFSDLSADPDLFTGDASRDYQFEIYRMMRSRCKDDWKAFEPHSNICWIHYLLDKLISNIKYSNRFLSSRAKDKALKRLLCDEYQNVLSFDSCFQLCTSPSSNAFNFSQ